MKKVLIIDDASFSYDAISELLPKDKYEIVGYAKNGEQGIRMYEELDPDIVTLDIIMPGMDGLETAAELISIDENAARKIIILSALYDQDTMDEMNELNIKYFLDKPIHFDALLKAVEDIANY